MGFKVAVVKCNESINVQHFTLLLIPVLIQYIVPLSGIIAISFELICFISSYLNLMLTNYQSHLAGLRHAVPRELKNNTNPRTISLSFDINNNVFYISKKRSKHYYSLLISEKAQFPSAVNKLQD